MSYEEMYKEALKRADSLTEKYGGRDFAEYVFPELAESEDERIRKKLYEFISDTLGDELDGYDISKGEALAYLEKQKEQKDYRKLYEIAKSEDEMIREAIIGIIKNSNIIDINVSEEKMIAYLEKQKEQKPAWSEEDEEMLKDIIAEIEATKQYFFTHDSEGRAQMQARIEWLKSLRPSWKPSEEQMKALERASTNEYLSAEQYDILVSLYEQLKQL